MPISLSCCAEFLASEGVRHHVDAEQGAIRVVFVTRQYRNARGEHLAIVRLDTPDEGYRCRVTIDRAFAVADDSAAIIPRLCQLAAETPLVGVEFDAEAGNLRMVVETAVEDGTLTGLQLLSMVDRIVEAAEAWHEALAAAATADDRSQTVAGATRRRRPRAA